MTFQERFGVLGRKRDHEAIIGVRQIEALKVCLLLDPPDPHQRLAKIGLRLARRVYQRHEHLFVSEPRLAHVILHDRIAAAEALLSLQPVPNPLRCVPLLFRLRLIVQQDLIDDSQPPT